MNGKPMNAGERKEMLDVAADVARSKRPSRYFDEKQIEPAEVKKARELIERWKQGEMARRERASDAVDRQYRKVRVTIMAGTVEQAAAALAAFESFDPEGGGPKPRRAK